VQTVDQVIDSGCRILTADFGQVDIARGSGGAGVAQQGLDLAEVQAAFQQMRGKAVA
jgi:hypothetical protein